MIKTRILVLLLLCASGAVVFAQQTGGPPGQVTNTGVPTSVTSSINDTLGAAQSQISGSSASGSYSAQSGASTGTIGYPPLAGAPVENVKTIDDAVALALKYNTSLKLAEEHYRRSQYEEQEVRANGYPKIELDANYVRYDKATTVNFGSDSVTIQPIDSRTARLVLTQPLDIAGLISTGKDIGRIRKELAKLELYRTRNEVVYSARNAFLGVLRAEAMHKLADETVEQVQEHVRISEAQFKAGAAARFDVTRAETQLANYQQQAVSARNGVDLAWAQLGLAVGSKVKPTLVDLPSDLGSSPYSELQPALDAAYKGRPELLQANASIKLAERGIKVATRGQLPSLFFTGNYAYNGTGGSFASRKFTPSIGAALTLPIWDGGITHARVKEARSDVESAKFTRELTRQTIDLDVQSALLSVTDARERYAVAGKEVEQATEGLRLADVRYKAGIGSAIEVTDAQGSLTLAQSNLITSRYDYELALARLSRAVGQ